MHQKLVLDPFLIMVDNQKQPLCTINSFNNKIYWKRIKVLKMLTLFFLLNPVLFNGQDFKMGPELVTSCSSGYKTSSEKFHISDILPDQVWWCNIKWFFELFQKIHCYFMQANSWYKLFHFHLSSWVSKVWKGSKKITKNWVSGEKRAF